MGGWVGGKLIPRIKLTSAKDLVEVEAELGNFRRKGYIVISMKMHLNLGSLLLW